MNYLELMKKVFLHNELGGNPKLAYEFSDADGKRTGRSGYSFGLVQFDIENNWMSLDCLRACRFRLKEVKRLYFQDSDITDLNKKLKDRKDIVDAYDTSHIEESIDHCKYLTEGIPLANPYTMLHIIDYHNQLYMSQGGLLHRFLLNFTGKPKSDDIVNFKLCHTKWGREHSDDVLRRARNIKKVIQEATQ